MEAAIKEKVNLWLSDLYDEETRKQIQTWLNQGNETEIIDSFYKNLEFGTGGLRGIMGPGTNRMNKYTVGMATQGLANYLKKCYPNQSISVAVAHDSRNNSAYFAKVVAEVFSANGIKVFLFTALRPTPELSFAIRMLKCQSGVVLTASHNPKEYNGYKAYWNDGAQMVAPHDKNTIAEVELIKDPSMVNFTPQPELIEYIDEAVDSAYIKMIKGLSISQDAIRRQNNLKIVYSPLHGTGITLVPKVLDELGFKNVQVVLDQATPDGNFPTVVYPNPEEKEAMTLALNRAKIWDADIVMATDPDADRVGIGLKNHKGEWQLLNGNQTAAILFYYMLEAWKNAGKITGNEMIVKTVVTSDILDKMAAAYNVTCINTLTGFKYIAAAIKAYEGKKQFIVGGEESYGYMIGDQVRDKDAIAACALLAEVAAYAKDKGMSMFEMLMDVYTKFGFYKEDLISITKKGKAGAEEIQQMMANFRSNPPKTIAGSPVIQLLDYKSGENKDLRTGAVTKIDTESSNVLQFITESGYKVSARPSGTEPKIKFYFSVNKPLASKADYDATEAALDGIIAQIKSDLGL
jgi:phosphoglucomutase